MSYVVEFNSVSEAEKFFYQLIDYLRVANRDSSFHIGRSSSITDGKIESPRIEVATSRGGYPWELDQFLSLLTKQVGGKEIQA